MIRDIEYINKKLSTLRKTRDNLVKNRKVIENVDGVFDKEKTDIFESNQFLIEKNNNMIKYWSDVIENVSTFDSDLIGHAIADLVSSFENRKYVYQKALYNVVDNYRVFDVRMTAQKRLYPDIIIDKEEKLDVYNDDMDNSLDSLKEKGKVIILSDGADALKTSIQFFKVNPDTLKFDSCIDYGKYGYVLLFMRQLFEYKLTYPNLGYEDINNILASFIIENIEKLHNFKSEFDEDSKKYMKKNN